MKNKEYRIREKLNFELKVLDLKNKRYDESFRIIKLIWEEPTRIYNPFLKLKAFDECKDTPVEVLPVVLLGIVKYLTTDFIKKTSKITIQ